MDVSANIFRAYDIRGIYPSELNNQTAVHIGKAVGTLARRRFSNSIAPPKFVVGMDDRQSSPMLKKNLISGILATGCNVVDVGVTITPAIHFFVTTQAFDVGINVTASHNPKEFNGFRLDFSNAQPFTKDEILGLQELIRTEDYVMGSGSTRIYDLNCVYEEYLTGLFSFNKKFKVVLDCGNGATSSIAPRIFTSLGHDVFPLYCEMDSAFPHGVPNTEDALFMEHLASEVVRKKADIGFAFDTDGDRLGIVDALGNLYTADYLLMLFAAYLLPKVDCAKVVYDVKSTELLSTHIKNLGGIPEMICTGHTHFVEALRSGALLGAEYSGHIYFGDKYFGYDDGIYAALRVLEIMETSGKALQELMAGYPRRYSRPEIKVACSDTNKFDVINTIKQQILPERGFTNVITIDGVRVEVPDTGWFLVRASNTTPYLSIRVEGFTEAAVSKLLEIVSDILNDVGLGFGSKQG